MNCSLVNWVLLVRLIFESTGPVFGRKKIIAVWKAEAFADIFEAVTKGPADADGFFGESEDLPFGLMERILGFNPADLVMGEVIGQEGGGVDFDER